MTKKMMNKKEYANFIYYVEREEAYTNYNRPNWAAEAHNIVWAILEGRIIPHCVSIREARLLVRRGHAGVVAHYKCGHTEEDPMQWEYLHPTREWAEYDGELPVLHMEVEEKCDQCMLVADAMEMEASMDHRFNGLRWIHCLDAYRGKGAETIRQHVKGFNALGSSAEVCCTDAAHMAGSVGIVVSGTVTGVFDYDCWSEISDEGKRYATRASFVGDKYEEFWPTPEHSYYEAWVKDAYVEEVIISEGILENHPRRLEAAYELADRYHVPLRVFERDEVIYDASYEAYAEL
jgi:hypothetical protein